MSFFTTIKRILGVESLKLKIESKPFFIVEDRLIEGKLHLNSPEDEQLKSIEIKFEEFYSAGRGSTKSSTTMRLGGEIFEGRYILGDQCLTLDFSFPFTYGKSKNERRIDKGGVIGTVGRVGKFLHNEKSKFKLVAIVVINGRDKEIREELIVKRLRKTERE